jgi:hypothetical protein
MQPNPLHKLHHMQMNIFINGSLQKLHKSQLHSNHIL